MKNYNTPFKPETCQLLNTLGVKSNSGMWFDKRGNLISGSDYITKGDIPAYHLPSLIADSEAMKLIFGEEEYWLMEMESGGYESDDYYLKWTHHFESELMDDWENRVRDDQPSWKYHSLKLLALLLQGQHEEAEKILIEAVKARLEER